MCLSFSVFFAFFFFFKQKTAYEMRISDWSSDVCSSDLQNAAGKKPTIANVARQGSMERVVLQLALEPFDIELQQVSFDKGSQRYASLKGGKVDVMLEQPGDVRGVIESGDFKAIPTVLKDRPPAIPDSTSMKAGRTTERRGGKEG